LVLAGDRVIVFAEVKSRANDAFGGAAAAVDARKRARLRRLALEWLAAHPEVRRAQLRFDVVAITGTKIDVIEAAF
jgi:putative endonuclease